MHIDSFINSFEYLDLNIKKYYFTTISLIMLILLFLVFNSNIVNYHKGDLMIESNKIVTIVDIKNLENITKNKKIIIERKTFTYLIEKIDNLYLDNSIYKKVTLTIKNFSEDKLANNSTIEYQIIKKRDNVFSSLIRIIKGDD